MTPSVTGTGYDRADLAPTVVHLGPGVFHRAHQAVYADAVLRTGEREGAVHAVSLRSPAVRDALAPQGFRYHVAERTDGPDGPRESVTAVGALLGIDVAAPDPEPALAALCAPAVTVVTMTVTEHGYCAAAPGGPPDLSRPEVRHDLEHPRSPGSMPGLLVEALRRRRAAGSAPFTVASCDNLTANGPATAAVVVGFAECLDPALARWIHDHVAFPSSMVDRMVPATTDDARARLRGAGVDDAWPVVTEPFSQWVLEDVFPTGRPRWERAGVELVGDVRPHEQAKLRILNAAHSALAYWGLLSGHEFVWQALADPVLEAAVRALLVTEVLPTLRTPPGWDLPGYTDQVLQRFANRALPYTTAKVAGDGSQKLPVRVLPTVREHLAAGAPAPWGGALLAAWLACVTGPRAGDLQVADAALPPLGARTPDGLLALPGFLDLTDPREAAFATRVHDLAGRICAGDVRAVLSSLPAQPALPTALAAARPLQEDL